MKTKTMPACDDRAMVLNPNKWPRWPFLPMKRPGNHGPECCFLVQQKELILYKTYMFGLDDLPGDTFAEKVKDVKTYRYDNVDALLADGWVVD